jgi:urease
MGDANASIPTVQPVYGQPMWGSQPLAASRTSLLFVSQVSLDNGAVASYGLRKRAVAVEGCRRVSKGDMKWNGKTPKMKVDAETYEVTADGEVMDVQPAEKLPLARAYNLF